MNEPKWFTEAHRYALQCAPMPVTGLSKKTESLYFDLCRHGLVKRQEFGGHFNWHWVLTSEGAKMAIAS